MRRSLRSFAGLVAFASIIFSVAVPAPAHALSFDPSRIIDDDVFDNVTSMTSAQIDAFLNEFPNSCLSTNNNFATPDPIGYNINQGYIFGSNVSGGTAIAHAAQAYDLNPQVLLTTLQKEQSLVSGGKGCYPNTPDPSSAAPCDLYGNGRIYNCTGACPFAYGGGCIPIAVGYGCPGRCDAAKEGFSNQIIRAAWLLKFSEQRAKGNINWAIVRGSWDNSDDLQSCYSGPMTRGNWQVCPSGGTSPYDGLYTPKDGTTIELKTGATAALYYYTPFLSGNKSFWNIFTGWFGDTQGLAVLPQLQDRYNALGGPDGYLGKPYTLGGCGIPGDGCYQNFIHGNIYWSAATGAWDVSGAIGSKWIQLGAERSILGYPTSGETRGLKNSGAYQNFQIGRIYWSANTDANPVSGGIGNYWLKAGAEKSTLGYPTSGEKMNANGEVYQDFEGGTIYWTAAKGAWAN
jgi:hypothetical protein